MSRDKSKFIRIPVLKKNAFPWKNTRTVYCACARGPKGLNAKIIEEWIERFNRMGINCNIYRGYIG